jgi:hypothetical protein
MPPRTQNNTNTAEAHTQSQPELRFVPVFERWQAACSDTGNAAFTVFELNQCDCIEDSDVRTHCVRSVL